MKWIGVYLHEEDWEEKRESRVGLLSLQWRMNPLRQLFPSSFFPSGKLELMKGERGKISLTI